MQILLFVKLLIVGEILRTFGAVFSESSLGERRYGEHQGQEDEGKLFHIFLRLVSKFSKYLVIQRFDKPNIP